MRFCRHSGLWHSIVRLGPSLVLLVPSPSMAQTSAPEESGRSCVTERSEPDALEAPPGLASIRRGPGFAWLTDASGLAENGCAPPFIANALLLQTVARAQVGLGIDPQLFVVLATGPLSCADIYYLPIANDVSGIGYAHKEGQELFDHSPESRLEGIIFLNDWPYWRARPEEFERAFNHEVGHRWGARVQALVDGSPSDELLGRQRSHWSYFLDTQGSPHEGNRWLAGTGALFRSAEPDRGSQFSALDLYLMGVVPAEAVGPFQLLRQVQTRALDCNGNALGRSSPPQRCEPVEVRAEPMMLGIDDILRVEGPRIPAASPEPRTLDVAVLVLESAGVPLSRDDCVQLGAGLEARLAAFSSASRGGVSLRNVTGPSEGCEVLAAAQTAEASVACSIAGARRARSQPWSLAFLAAAGACLCARQLSVRSPRGLRSFG